MSKVFHSPVAEELRAFLQFKRSLGYGYMRAEFSLWEFDRFLIEYAPGIIHGSLIARRLPGWQANQAANQSASPAMPPFSGSSISTCADHQSQKP